jgi:TonB-dependent receptor
MEPEGFLSAGVFHKDISDFLFTESRVFGLDVLDANGVIRSGYTFSGLENGGDGWLQGAEIFYSQTAQNLIDQMSMPDWLGGFGVRVSGTWTESEVDANGRNVKLPGTSAAVYNVQAIYEKYDLSVRLAYQYRTHWIQSLGANALGDTFWDDDEEIDLSVRYQVNDNLEWFFDAANIGDQAAIRYVGAPIFPIEHETFGERYITGIRFNF